MRVFGFHGIDGRFDGVVVDPAVDGIRMNVTGLSFEAEVFHVADDADRHDDPVEFLFDGFAFLFDLRCHRVAGFSKGGDFCVRFDFHALFFEGFMGERGNFRVFDGKHPGEDFHNRGRRCEEQIEVLRQLWTQEVVNFQGRWHSITHAGLNPLPVQRPIPIWIGGGAENVLRRIGRVGDGWFPQFPPTSEGQARIARMREYAKAAGRDPASVGVEGRFTVANQGPEECVAEARAWQEVGASHISVGTGGAGFTSPDQHIEAIRRVKEVMEV